GLRHATRFASNLAESRRVMENTGWRWYPRLARTIASNGARLSTSEAAQSVPSPAKSSTSARAIVGVFWAKATRVGNDNNTSRTPGSNWSGYWVAKWARTPYERPL